MSPSDSTGRIPKQAFLVSNMVLFAFCMASMAARLSIRIGVQKSFAVDDGVLLVGVGCLIAAMALLFNFVDELYVVGAIAPATELPPGFVSPAFDFKLMTVALILTWCAIVSVKFSYLLFFRKLIDRFPRMMAYWWFVAGFNAVISAYGASVYVAACPDFYSLKSLQCTSGQGVRRSFAFSMTQMILDIAGDLLILYIPCRLIWKVKIRWTQKIALSSSLCLTILTIICTITHIAGFRTGGTVKTVDKIWGTYWQFVAANLALTMTAATAFRTFFVSRAQVRRPMSPGPIDPRRTKCKRLLRSIFTPRSWRLTPRADSPGPGDAGKSPVPVRLEPRIPRGTMTGIRTFVGGRGETKSGLSQVLKSGVDDGDEDLWSESVYQVSAIEEGKQAQGDVTIASEDAC